MKKKTALCPCCSGFAEIQCCAPVLAGTRPAITAEALMRSRYTAFTQNNEAYLLQSWHLTNRPASLGLNDGTPQKWINLQIRQHEQQDAHHATVEFIARYRIGGRAGYLHETSRFIFEEGRWYYVDGDIHA